VVLVAGAVVAGWSLLRAVTTGGRGDPAAHGGTAGAPVAGRAPVARERGNDMAGVAVSCRRVVQIYRGEAGDVVALSGVDLSIAPGETLALVGPSGSGKSTLIALLSGLMRPSAGRITIGTYDIGKLSDADISRLRGTQIGVVLQGAARNLLPYATLAKNITVAQTRAARTRGIKLDHPERILDLVGLGGCGHLHLGDLTPGARQRAALAVGIATSPGLLLIDEPTSQLDTHGRDEVVSAIETVNAERGTTIVVVTHDTEVGARMGRAVTIRDGRVGAEGRGGQDFAVVASDGTVQLPPEVLGDFPPGTLFTVDRTDSTVSFAVSGSHQQGT
jgi:putative ABC transport system ATP-binding protein